MSSGAAGQLAVGSLVALGCRVLACSGYAQAGWCTIPALGQSRSTGQPGGGEHQGERTLMRLEVAAYRGGDPLSGDLPYSSGVVYYAGWTGEEVAGHPRTA